MKKKRISYSSLFNIASTSPSTCLIYNALHGSLCPDWDKDQDLNPYKPPNYVARLSARLRRLIDHPVIGPGSAPSYLRLLETYLSDSQRIASSSLSRKGQRRGHKALQIRELCCAQGAWETTCVGSGGRGRQGV